MLKAYAYPIILIWGWVATISMICNSYLTLTSTTKDRSKYFRASLHQIELLWTKILMKNLKYKSLQYHISLGHT